MKTMYISIAVAIIASQSNTGLAACNIIDGRAYGDCDGLTINTGTKAHLIVRSNLSESSIIEGATIFEGGSLLLSGTSNGDIKVLPGGTLIVTGIVNGDVNNEGGTLTIEGSLETLVSDGGTAMVGGTVKSVRGTGPVKFKQGAILNGIPFKDESVWP